MLTFYLNVFSIYLPAITWLNYNNNTLSIRVFSCNEFLSKYHIRLGFIQIIKAL